MSYVLPEAIEEYVGLHSSPERDLLEELAEETRRDVPGSRMLIGHVGGALLRMLVQLSGARRVLEVGTYTGYSALAMAEGMADDGELITCDVNPESTAVARKYWERSPHGRKITLKLGPALDTIPNLEGEFDFVFIDADKENYSVYWDLCVPKVRSGGMLAVDNVLWKGRVTDPQDEMTWMIDAFNKKVASDARVECVVLTVRDGITVARKI